MNFNNVFFQFSIFFTFFTQNAVTLWLIRDLERSKLMDDYNQNNINQFPENPNNNGNQENYGYNRPEYSFWAEKVSGPPIYDYHQYQNNPQPEQVNKKKSPGRRFIAFLFKAAVFGIISGMAFVGVGYLYGRLNPDALINKESYILGSTNDEILSEAKLKVGSTEHGTVSNISESSVMKVAEETMPSIVSITSISTNTDIWFGMEYPSEGSGSGIIVGKDEKELLIATNNHVVDGTDKITVTFIDDSQVDAVIKGTDSMADLAVIAVDLADVDQTTIDAIKIAKIGNSDDIKVGEMTIAIGNAMGYGQSLTVGYVSAKDRKIEVSDSGRYTTMVLLQTDAAINPGNSGGALLNINGEVIGINTVKFADYKIEGMGYAIPISRAIPIINELMSREILKPEEQGFLGVGPQDVTEEVSDMFGIPIGVYISTVVEGSAADKAGLQVGDVIQYINDVEITSGIQLRELISSIRVGTDIEIVYMRHINGDYKKQTVTVTLGARE
ncbi:MAG: PDZ domain-containing protein [Anaerolineaceae bacterium]|nr:MAG: PDZ domain-containing protein [Anaerolineaceae bacterium]